MHRSGQDFFLTMKTKTPTAAKCGSTTTKTTSPLDAEIDKGLWKQVKKHAAARGITTNEWVSQAIASLVGEDAASTVNITFTVPARVARALKYHKVTAEVFVNELTEAVFGEECLTEALECLHPLKGNPGYISGLFLIDGKK